MIRYVSDIYQMPIPSGDGVGILNFAERVSDEIEYF